MNIERWAPVAGFDSFYEVSDLGRVRSLDREAIRQTGTRYIKRGRILKAHKDGGGYPFVRLCADGLRSMKKVHHLVAAAFLPPSDKPQVNHKDFDRANNAATNLEWATAQENSRHRVLGIPGIPAADAAARMEVVYQAHAHRPRLIAPAGTHPKVKACTVCGDPYEPSRPAHRARQKTCSKTCANTLRGRTERETKAARGNFAPDLLPGSHQTPRNRPMQTHPVHSASAPACADSLGSDCVKVAGGHALTMVRAQAEDPGLWLPAASVVEDYLQSALRRLHAAVEADAEGAAIGCEHGTIGGDCPFCRDAAGVREDE